MKRRIPIIDIAAVQDEAWMLLVQLLIIGWAIQKHICVCQSFPKRRFRWGNGLFDLFTGMLLITVKCPIVLRIADRQISLQRFIAYHPVWLGYSKRIAYMGKRLLMVWGWLLWGYCCPEEASFARQHKRKNHAGRAKNKRRLVFGFSHYLATLYQRLAAICARCFSHRYMLYEEYPVYRPPLYLMNRIWLR
ncbi:MAG: hypothetical protein IRZ29_05615 [Thermoflavifilum sp.]|nr:hypothetical protein [Thermoflavifilum sp.]